MPEAAPTTPVTPDKADRIYYYVSLPLYKHKVFKCQGYGAENPEHRAFYIPHFEKHGGQNAMNNSDVKLGPFRVLTFQGYRGNLVDENGEAFSG
jgi:hypothetical protein